MPRAAVTSGDETSVRRVVTLTARAKALIFFARVAHMTQLYAIGDGYARVTMIMIHQY